MTTARKRKKKRKTQLHKSFQNVPRLHFPILKFFQAHSNFISTVRFSAPLSILHRPILDHIRHLTSMAIPPSDPQSCSTFNIRFPFPKITNLSLSLRHRQSKINRSPRTTWEDDTKFQPFLPLEREKILYKFDFWTCVVCFQLFLFVCLFVLWSFSFKYFWKFWISFDRFLFEKTKTGFWVSSNFLKLQQSHLHSESSCEDHYSLAES